MCADVASATSACVLTPQETRLLTAPEAPIVLLEKRHVDGVAPVAANVAPGSALLGVMLPYTPLHHLLVAEVGRPLVCTSGNLSDEPMVIDEAEVVERLGGIADLFLVHDRPIVRHVDDSIARVMLGRELVMRRARGYAPLPVDVGWRMTPTLAVGGHLKNAVAMTSGSQVFISQHIGDLGSPAVAGCLRARRSAASSACYRSSPRWWWLTVTPVMPRPPSPAARIAGAAGPASHGACRVVHGREPAERPGAGRGVGWHRRRAGRHRLGRRVPARVGRRASRGSRASARSACLAASARCASPGARRSDCCMR